MIHQRGFTLIELMITIAVLSILLGIAVPGFQATIQNNRSTTLANELITALNLAKSEAVRRGTDVTACASNDGATCSGNWTDGWIVSVVGGPLLRAWASPRPGAVIGAAATGVTFRPLGNSTGLLLQSEFNNCKGDQARTINVNAAGRISVSRAACQ